MEVNKPKIPPRRSDVKLTPVKNQNTKHKPPRPPPPKFSQEYLSRSRLMSKSNPNLQMIKNINDERNHPQKIESSNQPTSTRNIQTQSGETVTPLYMRSKSVCDANLSRIKTQEESNKPIIATKFPETPTSVKNEQISDKLIIVSPKRRAPPIPILQRSESISAPRKIEQQESNIKQNLAPISSSSSKPEKLNLLTSEERSKNKRRERHTPRNLRKSTPNLHLCSTQSDSSEELSKPAVPARRLLTRMKSNNSFEVENPPKKPPRRSIYDKNPQASQSPQIIEPATQPPVPLSRSRSTKRNPPTPKPRSRSEKSLTRANSGNEEEN